MKIYCMGLYYFSISGIDNNTFLLELIHTGNISCTEVLSIIEPPEKCTENSFFAIEGYR